MVRPCFIVVDVEHAGTISTRKLVIESAKLNVITAYSGAEAIETVQKFPAVDGVVCNSEVRDVPLSDLIRAIKQTSPKLPIVLVGPADGAAAQQADYLVRSFDPRNLLDVLQQIAPQRVSEILHRDDQLRETENRRKDDEQVH